LRHLKKANGIGDKPMPQLKLTIPEPWWRRRDSKLLDTNNIQSTEPKQFRSRYHTILLSSMQSGETA